MSKRHLTLLTLLSLGLSVAIGTPAGTIIRNVAWFDADGTSTPSNAVALTTTAVCGVTLTPTSQAHTVQAGQSAEAAFTLTNTGNDTFTFPLTLTTTRGAARSSADTLTLASGAQGTVRVTIMPEPSATATTTLTTACPDGPAVTGVATVTSQSRPLTVSKTVDKAGPIKPGDRITYVITVTNPNPVPVTGTVADTFDPRLHDLSFQQAPTRMDQMTASWTLTLAPSSTQRLTIEATTPTDTDDTVIRNVALLDSFVQQSTPSNAVSTVIYDPKISITKAADTSSAAVGQRVNYALNVTNRSMTASVPDVTVVDTLPTGLQAVDGTLTVNGDPATDLDPNPQVIKLNLGRLNAGQHAKINYRAVLTPAAATTTRLTNIATVGEGDAQRSATLASHTLRVLSAPGADLTGRVYVDRDRTGTFTAPDTPIRGARVLLAGGQSVLTDEQGRYHFANLRAGPAALQLDPSSVQYRPAPVSGDYLRTGARLINLYHLASSDFPLLPDTAAASAERATTVRRGAVTLSKTVRLVTGGFEVTWVLRSDAAQTVTVSDPLPEGAALSGDAPRTTFTLTPGQDVLQVYRVTFTGAPEAVTTDPALTLGGTP